MLLKIIFSGFAICIINIFLKKQLNEFVLPVEIVFLAVATMLVSEYVQEFFSKFSELLNGTEYGSEVISSAVKGAGICIVTKFSADICAESGNKVVADVIEFVGRIMLVAIAVPYFESIIRTALTFIE